MDQPAPETLHLAMFGGAPVQYWPDPQPLPPEGAALLQRFLDKPPETLRPVARHVYAYFRDTAADTGLGTSIPDEDAIWSHVSPLGISIISGSHTDDAWYISVEANVTWEVEHGLQMVWREGEEIVKVGSFDGHVTNADAYDDDTLADFVYRARTAQWTTRRDG